MRARSLPRTRGRVAAGASSAARKLQRRAFLYRMRRQVHPERFAEFGADSVIVPPVVISGAHRIRIGEHVLIHDRVWMSVVEQHRGRRFDPELRIGDRTNIGRDNYFSCVGCVEVGADVLTGPNVLIADSYHGYENPDRPIIEQPMAEPRPVRIGSGVILNPNVCVLAGVTIGNRSFIGAGAVVNRDVPANCVAAGNPARVIRHWDAETRAWAPGAPPGPGLD